MFCNLSGPQLSRQIKIHDSKFEIHHGKFKFTVANSKSPRQIQVHHSKFKIHRSMGASDAGGPLRISGDGGLVLVCLYCLLGTGVSWQGWRSDFLGLTDAHRVLPNFLLLFYCTLLCNPLYIL